MADPIKLDKFEDKQRIVSGRSPALPMKNQAQYGAFLHQQLDTAINTYREKIAQRPLMLPQLPVGIQVLIRGATSSSGKTLLDSAKLKGLKLEVVEERADGLVIALSHDPELTKVNEAVENFTIDARTASGRRKRGINTIFTVENFEITPRELRIGELLSELEITQTDTYLVDIEIAAGSELGDEGIERRDSFRQYLNLAGALIFGNGPIIEEDYALYRARMSGTLLDDLLNNHIWVKFIDLPPQVELEGIELRNIDEPSLPPFQDPLPSASKVCAIDSGVSIAHPILRIAMNNNYHRSFIPGEEDIGDTGTRGHGTAISSLLALGSLRETIVNNNQPIRPVPVVLAKILDLNGNIPDSINLKTTIPAICTYIKENTGISIFNHSIASRAQYNTGRMSVWAETIDRTCYDQDCLFVISTGNVDGSRPTFQRVAQDLNSNSYPYHLSDEVYRLRNPAQAINALTVGAYTPHNAVSFARGQGISPLADSNFPSPCTRTGFGFLGEIKPEVVEEGGNWYIRDGTLEVRPDFTDVAVAAHDYLVTGKLIRFSHGTSFSAAKISNLAARIQEQYLTENVDLIKASIINSAAWPHDFGIKESNLKLFGYGVPNPARALNIGGPRCVINIEDNVKIGNVQFFRIPWPSDLLEQLPDVEIQVSVTLAYRAPVRKSNKKYRGTALEWKMSKRGEPPQDFFDRCIYQGVAIEGDEDEDTDEIEASTIADWDWNIKTNLRKRGTSQKDWFRAPASYFGDELFLGVIGRRGWMSREQQQQGWYQPYAITVCIEVLGQFVPIHERIDTLIRIPYAVRIR